MLLADGGYRGPLAEFVKGTWMGFWSCTLLPRTCSQVCGISPQIDHRKDILLDRKLQENDYRLRAKQWIRRSHVVPLFLPNPPWKKLTDRFKTACRITRDVAYTSADFCTKVYTAPLFLAPVAWTGHKNVCVLSFFWPPPVWLYKHAFYEYKEVNLMIDWIYFRPSSLFGCIFNAIKTSICCQIKVNPP